MAKTPNKILHTSSFAQVASGYSFRDPNKNKGFPLVLHKDGHVCWPITDYLLHRYRNLHKKMGTINTDANSLSLLVQYLDTTNTYFTEMFDHSLVDFRDQLFEDPSKRQASQINKHLRNTIYFLRWYNHELHRHNPDRRRIIAYNDDNVNPQITIYREKYTYKDAKGRPQGKERIRHESMLEESVPVTRHAINSNNIDKLWAATPIVCQSPFRKARDEITLLLFEVTGGRRSELFNIKLPECQQAIETSTLNIHTAKSNNKRRDIPVSKELIRRLDNYIKYARKPIIQNAIKNQHILRDHEYLLIGRYGKQWSERSFNEEISLLAKCAGIDVPAHPHLFRHRKFTMLAEETKKLDPTKRLLILKKLGGWSNDKSPSNYIDIQAIESAGWQKAYLNLSKHEDADHIRRQIHTKLYEIREKSFDISIIENIDDLDNLINNLFDL